MKLLDIGTNIPRGTNILTIEVPPQLRVKHPTGIGWIDNMLGTNQFGSGFTPSTVGFMTGSPGGGKTTLMLTIADALTKQGHVVLLNGGEENAFQIRLTCERLGLTCGFIISNDVFVDDVIAHARELLKTVAPGKALFVFQDSLQMLDDQKYDTGKTTKATPVNCAVKLIKFAKETFSCVFWIHQVTKDGIFVGDNQVKHAADFHMEVKFDVDKKSSTFGERFLRMSKNRFGGTVPDTLFEMAEGGRVTPKKIVETLSEDDDEIVDLSMAAE